MKGVIRGLFVVLARMSGGEVLSENALDVDITIS